MQITQLHPPTDGGTLFVGHAENNRGRKYLFFCAGVEDDAASVFCQEPSGFYKQITPGTPRQLQRVITRAIAAAVRT